MTTLPAGDMKRVKVSGAWVRGESDRPYLLAVGPGAWLPVAAVVLAGESRLVAADGGVRSVWVETTGEVSYDL